ncbi:hypothetical protein FRC02_001318 [Tulasnella sp. 418]|nr:hypothetical protein FRC02_001318 [Tulasnella sp. 418]
MDPINAMETVVKTPELVNLILEQLASKQYHWVGPDPDSYSYDTRDYAKRRATLASCALVNRLISNEAIRTLWRSVDSMKAFMCLIPSDAVRVDGLYFPFLRHKIWRVTRPLVPSDWEVVIKHAPLIRTFTPRLEAESMNSFLSYRDFFPGKILLPNLAELDWTGRLNDDFLPLLLSPHLRKIKIDIMCDEVSEEGKARLLGGVERVPRLESFHIGGFLYQQNSLKLTQVLLKGLQLRSLGLIGCSIAISDLLLIRSLPNLESLSLSTKYLRRDGISDSFGALVEGSAPGFPRLQDLAVSGLIQVVGQFIEQFGARPHRKITINILDKDLPPISGYIDLIGYIGNLCHGLTHIVIEQSSFEHQDVGSEGPDEAIEMTDLSPLTNFSELRVLHLNFPYAINVRNGDIQEICVFFTKLEQLGLCSTPMVGGYEPELTPECLKWIAMERPQIRVLALFMDSQWTQYLQFELSRRSTSCLDTLDVGHSRIQWDPDRSYEESDVALSLCVLFPCLSSIETRHPYHRDFSLHDRDLGHISDVETDHYHSVKGWERIQNSLQGLRRFRTHVAEGVFA